VALSKLRRTMARWAYEDAADEEPVVEVVRPRPREPRPALVPAAA
jgi:hypothetical protein